MLGQRSEDPPEEEGAVVSWQKCDWCEEMKPDLYEVLAWRELHDDEHPEYQHMAICQDCLEGTEMHTDGLTIYVEYESPSFMQDCDCGCLPSDEAVEPYCTRCGGTGDIAEDGISAVCPNCLGQNRCPKCLGIIQYTNAEKICTDCGEVW